MQHSTLAQKAFTLIELSIVLVIIGILAGGVLVGRSMIRQSQVNSVMTDGQKYIAALISFEQKYASLPGDMANATDYWGAAGGLAPYDSTTACITVSSANSTATCNGNGDGLINPGGNEVFRIWQHMTAAGYITGSFTGTNPSGAVIGVNVPVSSIDRGTFNFNSIGAKSGDTIYFDGVYRHRLAFGDVENGAGMGPALTGIEMQGIDSKNDDGKPATGLVRTVKAGSLSYSSTCATTAVTATAAYTKDNIVRCNLILIPQL